MRIKLHTISVHIVVMLLLVGCATTNDPSQGGFFNGVGNILNGGYEKRIAGKKKEYNEELAAQKALKEKAEKLRHERAAVKEKLNKANQRLMDLEQKIKQQLEAIEKDRKKTKKAQKKLQELKKAQEQLEATMRNIAQTRENDLPVDDLKERSKGILKDLDDIDEIVQRIQKM